MGVKDIDYNETKELVIDENFIGCDWNCHPTYDLSAIYDLAYENGRQSVLDKSKLDTDKSIKACSCGKCNNDNLDNFFMNNDPLEIMHEYYCNSCGHQGGKIYEAKYIGEYNAQ
jgi:hypothetical protein